VPLVTSLLTAIVRADGDALVLHAGERPYIVAPTGQTELASRVLTLEAVKGMLREMLPADAQHALDEYGAVQQDIASPHFARNETFSVIAARGGDDIWIEIRRRRAPAAIDEPVLSTPSVAPVAPEEPVASGSRAGLVVQDPPSSVQDPSSSVQDPPSSVQDPSSSVQDPSSSVQDPPYVPEPEPQPEPAFELESETWNIELETENLDLETVDLDTGTSDLESPALNLEAQPEPEPELVEPEPELEPEPEPAPYDIGSPAEVHEISLDAELDLPLIPIAPATIDEPALRPAIVLPLARSHVRGEQPARFSPAHHTSSIERLLRIAAARGASTLYLTSQARPSIRVDGEISAIEGESALSEPDVEALMLDIIPERNREALRSQAGTEWICDVPDVGRIRCVTFRDHRGAGGIFRMIPARAISAEQLGLSREIQGLCAEAEGLVLVTGPRSSGKSTLISAFVDLINRSRSDHVITLEDQIKFVHENRGSLVSQREVRGDRNELLSVARAALRENPDVLVIEDFGSPEIVTLALEAAQSGHLVIGALTAHTATEAVDRIIDQAPPERRQKVQLALAQNLRGIVVQVLLRKTGGGRVAAREVLLNTRAVANLIAEGKTSQLPMAIDSGRKHGMVALNDALVAFVQGGIVDSREAYRQAADQQGFLAMLKRQGIDTSFVERLA
jgi:twitching motility protein PilT